MAEPNPFFHRGPIRDPTYFFGREHEAGQALSLLGNSQSISLVGQRRIGKTSFLFHISDPEVLSQHSLSLDEHLFVYVDCGGLGGLDQPNLYRVLLEEVGDEDGDVLDPWRIDARRGGFFVKLLEPVDVDGIEIRVED